MRVQISKAQSPTPFKCPAAGIFREPSDCKKYYMCPSTLVEYMYECPGNSYFNELTVRCSTVLSPACQAQLSLPASTTLPNTDSLAASGTSVPFKCSAAGVFRDPVDCKKAHRCTTSLVDNLYECPGNTYFNEFTLKCGNVLSPICKAQLSSPPPQKKRRTHKQIF